MTPLTIGCARAVRDGGIDAMAALDDALRLALVGASPHAQQDLKRAFGHVMGEISVILINPAMRAFPELELEEKAWASIARTRAAARSNAG